jgi:hypothetical protein
MVMQIAAASELLLKNHKFDPKTKGDSAGFVLALLISLLLCFRFAHLCGVLAICSLLSRLMLPLVCISYIQRVGFIEISPHETFGDGKLSWQDYGLWLV